jgi:hypothetical protein
MPTESATTGLSPQQIGLIVAGVFVLFSLFVYGIGDLLRLSIGRVAAISSVVFRDSIRKRILWLAPLAMFGVVLVSQYQRSVDEADSIRQTVKFCLFASGFLVTVAAVLLSCTNLARDIETKVIFTVVTKPTSRLEIALGKLVGFARVTGTLLIMMGLFTLLYLSYRTIPLQRGIEAKLADPTLSDFNRQWLEHQREEGLLATRVIRNAPDFQILGLIDPAKPDVRYMSNQQQLWLPFEVTPEQLTPAGVENASPGEAGAVIAVRLEGRRISETEFVPTLPDNPFLVDPVDFTNRFGQANVFVNIFDEKGSSLIAAPQINGGRSVFVRDVDKLEYLDLDPAAVQVLAQVRRFYLVLSGVNPNFVIGVHPQDKKAQTAPAKLIIPATTQEGVRWIMPRTDFTTGQPDGGVRGSEGRFGQQLNGPGEQLAGFGRYRFTGVNPNPVEGQVPLEIRFAVERGGDEDQDTGTEALVKIVDRASGRESPPQRVALESFRTTFVTAPAEYFASGDFDVIVEVVSTDRVLGATPMSIGVVESRYGFILNLFFSMLTQWMLAILVSVIGFFCSTRLSWPIAIMLTLALITGRWAVNQVRDSLQPGIGAQVAQSLGGDYREMRVIANTFDGLARLLNTVADFLPDIDAFSTVERIERMVAVPMSTLTGAGLVLVIFGAPLFAASYVLLRNKEVAP